MPKTLKDMSQDELKAVRTKLQNTINAKGPQDSAKEQQLLGIVHSMLDPNVATPKGDKQHSVLGSHAQATMNQGPIHSLADVYEDGPNQIWYAKPNYKKLYMNGVSHMHEENITPPDHTKLDMTHTQLGGLAESDLRTIVGMMQGNEWSPNGEARQFVRDKGLRHTSMGSGDVIVTPERTVFIDKHGFYDLGRSEEVQEDMNYGAIIDGKAAFQESQPMAFSVGDTVFSGSKSGKFVRFTNADRTTALVELSDGSLDVFPVQGLSLQKSSIAKRAASWMVGEAKLDEYKDFVPNNTGYKVGQTLYCGSRSGTFIQVSKDESGQLMILVNASNGGVVAFPADKTSPKKPSFLKKVGSFMSLEGLEEDAEIECPYMPGQMLYCGTRSGKFVRMAKDMFDHTVKVMVQNAEGNKIVLPADKVTTKKPGLMQRAGSFIAGESIEESTMPRIIALHYFNTAGTPSIELAKYGMKEDKNGKWYLPQYDKSGAAFDRNFTTLVRSFGQPNTKKL